MLIASMLADGPRELPICLLTRLVPRRLRPLASAVARCPEKNSHSMLRVDYVRCSFRTF